MEKIIPVVAACIVDPAKGILLHKKNEPRNRELYGKWEFPGGMMEYGEDPYTALRREVREELAREIYILRLLHAQTNIYKDMKHYLVLFYLCSLHGDLEINGCQWFSAEEINYLDVLPGTKEVVDLLAEISLQKKVER